MINEKKYRLFSQLSKKVVIGGIATCFALLFSSASLALKTDRDQPADIDADDVEIDFKTGKRIFTGNVRVIQGTLRIKADKIVAQYKDGELYDATAYGSPAKFRQRPDDKPDDVEGEGKTIYVHGKNNTITLIKNASLKQGFDTARGQEIFYNMANDTMKLKGGVDIGKGRKKGDKKQKDDEFFKDEPAAPTKNTSKPKENSETTSTTDSTEPDDSIAESTDSNTELPPTIRNSVDELPEKLVLPKKQSTSTRSSGRSRLIIVPK